MTAAELLDWLRGHDFLPVTQVEEFRARLSEFSDARALAKELIQRNALTPYQVNQILQGKGGLLVVGANRLLERIGEGGMGQVFKAWNTRLERVVAVKMIHKEHLANNRALGRFRQEMRSAAQLDHPNIVLLRDADEVDGRPYLVMDFVEGTDLYQRVKQHGPLPLGEAATYAQQAALGLQHAFERGVIHRDIKPGNLLLARGADQSPLVKILDFGLARLDSEMHNSARLTLAGNLIGTIDFIAPEQAQDAHAADIRADLYSLGCTLFYLLTGAIPFPGATFVDKVAARTNGEPPSVRNARPAVPAGLDAVVRRLMARRPEDRYQTPHDAVQALTPFTRLTTTEEATVTLDQSDLAAALTAKQLAQAVPAQPVPGIPIVHAVPVAQALAVATPVTVDTSLTAHDEPFGFTGPQGQPAAEQFGGSTPLARAASVAAAAEPKPSPVRLLFYTALVAVLSTAVILGAIRMRGSRTPATQRPAYGPNAGLEILPLEPVTFKEGNSKFVIVKIQRKEFSGPVELTVKDPPNGVSAQTITFSDKQDTSQFRLTVSFGIGAMKKDLRVVARAENLQAETLLPLTVVTNRNVKTRE